MTYSAQSRDSYQDPKIQLRDLPRISPDQAQMSANEKTTVFKPSSTTRVTAAGVQVDPKKRKRQFANRTKTGCGTCRRRKKKCDEGKPECAFIPSHHTHESDANQCVGNNCQRGGFICEGYANKVPWPKNGTPKPHPPIVSKDRFPADPAQLYHR